MNIYITLLNYTKQKVQYKVQLVNFQKDYKRWDNFVYNGSIKNMTVNAALHILHEEGVKTVYKKKSCNPVGDQVVK